MGEGVFIGDGVLIDFGFPWLIRIEEGATITAGVRILAHDASVKRHLDYTLVAPVLIGRDAYVGADSVILPGVTIGDGAIIGAGSVVTNDIPAGTVAAGVPARPIRTVEEHIQKAKDELRLRPRYSEIWTDAGKISAGAKREMREHLASGPGYVP